jgi:hypothetical protein
MKNAKLQVTGHATIVKSAELDDETKAKVLEAPEGKHREIRAVLKDSKGNDVILKGKLKLSSKGSLTVNFGMKVSEFELVEVDDVKDTAEAKASSVESLAKELLG